MKQTEEMRKVIEDIKINKLIYKYKRSFPTFFPDFLETRIRKDFSNRSEIKLALSFIFETLPSSMPLSERYKIAKLNIRITPYLKQIILKKDPFILTKSIGKQHSDSSLEFQIRKHGNIFATFSFYFVPSKDYKNLEMHIDLVQGKRDKSKVLKEFSTVLRENWRIYIVKQLKEFCDKHGMKCIGHLPKRYRFGLYMVSDKKYFMQVRQYIQTYLKAGMKTTEISLMNLQDKFKQRIIENLKDKAKNKVRTKQRQRKALQGRIKK
jgi:hypothetical protein